MSTNKHGWKEELRFNDQGLVVEPYPKAEAETEASIFKSEMGTAMQDRPDARGAGYAKSMGLAAQLHANTVSESAEPDWQGMLLQAKNERAKWTIRAARDSWKDEQRINSLMQMQAEQEAHIQAVIQRPNRNKDFYKDLQTNDPRTYWSVPCQRQMRNDKATMGLAFHLKARK